MPSAQGLSFSLYLLGRTVLPRGTAMGFSVLLFLFFSLWHGLREGCYDLWKPEGRIPWEWMRLIRSRTRVQHWTPLPMTCITETFYSRSAINQSTLADVTGPRWRTNRVLPFGRWTPLQSAQKPGLECPACCRSPAFQRHSFGFSLGLVPTTVSCHNQVSFETRAGLKPEARSRSLVHGCPKRQLKRQGKLGRPADADLRTRDKHDQQWSLSILYQTQVFTQAGHAAPIGR